LFAVGSVAQQHAASSVAEGAGWTLVRSLISRPRWWAGLLGDAGGYATQAAALGVGSVLLVQPLSVASLLFALPLSAWFNKKRLSPRQWLLAMALTAALVTFVVLGNPTAGAENAPFARGVPALVAALVLVGFCVGCSVVTQGALRALLLGAATGLLYGLCVPLTKTVVDIGAQNLLALVGTWQSYALVCAGLTGFYLQQRSFQAGALAASFPAMTVSEPLIGAVFGFLVLDEQLQVSGWGWAAIGLSVLVMCAAAIELARTTQDGPDERAQSERAHEATADIGCK
jgi:drug/metabolite transporter (DMT)-like permease